MPEPQFDPLGYIRRLEQIQADLMMLRTDTDAQLARILRNQTAILAAINKPAWLSPPPSTPAPAPSPAVAPQDTTTIVFAPIIDVGGQTYSLLNQIITLVNQVLAGEQIIEGLFPPPSKATHISVELPSIKRKDTGKMANFEINDDWVVTATIKTTDAAGDTEPVPAGDVFSAASSSPSLGVAIGADANGNPAVVMTPMVQASPNITVTVSDSAGLAMASFVVDIVPDVTPTNIVVDLSGATHTTQATPTAPGP